MTQEALKLIQTRRLRIQGVGFFIIFVIAYFLVDHLNMEYALMSQLYGSYLVAINITLNLVMSLLSAFLLSLSTANLNLKGTETTSSNMSYLSIIFGIMTYGCTPCVISFFASIGIAFSVIALPLAGLPYKFISLLLILIGIGWTFWEIEHGRCKVKDVK